MVSPTELLKHLWYSKFFITEKNFEDIKKELCTLDHNPENSSLASALLRADYLKRTGKRGNYVYIQKYTSKQIIFTNEVFPVQLVKDLGKAFETDLNDLKLNFGYSGTCTAFLLRKILEKLIFLVLSKNGMHQQLKKPNGEIITLSSMLSFCTSNTIKGTPIIMQKTAKEIEGIKFLGDTSCHNPLTNVKMETIIPVMPFIITAYEELLKKM